MKLSRFAVLIAFASLASCMAPAPPEWSGTPNPLDVPSLDWHSSAWGTFGPGGEHVPYRPELSTAPQ